MRRALLVIVGVALCASASAQLIAANDQTSPSRDIWYVDITTGARTLLLTGTTATAWGMAYDPNTSTLYWNNGGTLYKSPFSMSGLTPVVVGSMTFGGSAMNVTGMGFDAVNNKLVGYRSVTTPGFYEISVIDATCTLLATTPTGTDFGGLDYDLDSGKFYGLNDSTGLQGRGLYEITNIYAAPVYSLIAAYPAGDTDIDGLGMGANKAFMVNDVNTQPIYVYDFSLPGYGPNLPSPFTGTNGIFSAGAFIPEPASLLLIGVGLLGVLRRR